MKKNMIVFLVTFLILGLAILARAERIDETALRKFLQDEGIKGHVRVY